MDIIFRYSTLKLVPTTEDGDIMRAVNSYMGVNRMTSKAMTAGTATHNYIKEYHAKTGKLPQYIADFILEYFGDTEQKVILEERKQILLFEDGEYKIYLSGEGDCVLESSLAMLDWKSSFLEAGKKGTSMSYYLNSDQVDVYSLMWAGINKGMYIKLDNNKIIDYGIKRLDDNHKSKILETYTNKARKLFEVVKDLI
jgi:hypothetical protein